MQNNSRRLLWYPFMLTLVGTLFCFWTTLGNELTFCVTTGCALFQDVTLGGISLWYYGMGTFMILSVLAVSGFGQAGLLLSGLCLLGDLVLLLIMMVTAPCIACLVVAFLFAITYASFRYELRPREDRMANKFGFSWLLCLWALAWLVNVSAVIRAELGPWAIQGDSAQAGIHMYFSPSCSSCAKGLKILSGNIDVAFYPVAEHDADVALVAQMLFLRQQGKGLYQAHQIALQENLTLSFWQSWSPSFILLRFRMLRNKAHVFTAGGKVVPFFEYRGLPAHIAQKADAEELARLRREAEEAMRDTGNTMPFTPRGEEQNIRDIGVHKGNNVLHVPVVDGIAGSCGGTATPCPD